MKWITDRQPTEADADDDGDVKIPTRPNSEAYQYMHWNRVGPGMPWQHTRYWTPPSDPEPEPELAAPDRLSEIEQRLTVLEARRRELATRISTVAHWVIQDGKQQGGDAPAEPEPQPAPEPAAIDRPTFAVGQKWKNRDGQVVTIVAYCANPAWPFVALRPVLTSAGNWHTLDGYYYCASRIDKRDLIELISEPEPAPEATTGPALVSPVAEPPEISEAIRAGAAPFYVVVTPDDSGGRGGGRPAAWETQILEGDALQSVLRYQARMGGHLGSVFIAECWIIAELTSEAPAQ